MVKMRKYTSSLRENVHMWLRKLPTVDILVGIPCYNCEESIGHVVKQAALGISKHFPGKKGAVFVSDGGSLDDTREKAYLVGVPEGVQRRVTIYRGLPGKGTALRAIFEVAVLSKARAIAVVDADLKSIGPDWIRLLLEPILDRSAEFVAPYYRRHKFDGTITNHIVYPMTRALYGADVRQPIGGDFGFSPEMAAFCAEQDVWETDVASFGVDIWITTSAINEGYKVVQASLGKKIHGAKDPASDLAAMFQQVVSTLFFLMGRYARQWRQSQAVRRIPVVGDVGNGDPMEPVAVSLDRLRSEFVDGFSQFRPMYREILTPEIMERLEEVCRCWSANENAELDADLWSRVLYDFAFAYQMWARNRRRLVDIITPLYFGRTHSYCRQVKDMPDEEAERVVQEQAAIFERNRPYLLAKRPTPPGYDMGAAAG